jgi:hypothetical protein
VGVWLTIEVAFNKTITNSIQGCRRGFKKALMSSNRICLCLEQGLWRTKSLETLEERLTRYSNDWGFHRLVTGITSSCSKHQCTRHQQCYKMLNTKEFRVLGNLKYRLHSLQVQMVRNPIINTIVVHDIRFNA